MKCPRTNAEGRVGVAGCKHTTRDLIFGLRRAGFAVDHCITLTPELAEQHQVAGYLDLRPFLEEFGVPYSLPRTYSLKNSYDREQIVEFELDVLLVMGWQRLIPDWLLEKLTVGAFGMHGSNKPLPHGRGRSPMNWSLIQGKKLFYTHLFKYLPGVDDGPIVGQQIFDITDHDTCHTLHFKNTLAMIRLCCDHLPAMLAHKVVTRAQPLGEASYYPKREAEDGAIFWEDSAEEIYNLVRGVTHPFPGAFSFFDGVPSQQIYIWRALPFDTHLQWPEAVPGEIVEVFYDGSFLVRAGDTSLLVLESSGHRIDPSAVGHRLTPGTIKRKIWENLPR